MNLDPLNLNGRKSFTAEQIVALNQTLSPEEVKRRYKLGKKDLRNYRTRVVRLRRRGVPLRRWEMPAKKLDLQSLIKLAQSFTK